MRDPCFVLQMNNHEMEFLSQGIKIASFDVNTDMNIANIYLYLNGTLRDTYQKNFHESMRAFDTGNLLKLALNGERKGDKIFFKHERAARFQKGDINQTGNMWAFWAVACMQNICKQLMNKNKLFVAPDTKKEVVTLKCPEFYDADLEKLHKNSSRSIKLCVPSFIGGFSFCAFIVLLYFLTTSR